MTKKNLLLINKHQLGSLTDSYKWCYYLKDEYNITLLCFDTGLPKIEIKGVKVKYIKYNGSLKIRGIRYLLSALWYILFFKGKIMVVYFEHCDILKRIFPFKKILLDIRTLSISPNRNQRKKTDNAIISACKIFDKVSVISEGVKQKIGEVGRDVCILPLGADCFSNNKKNYSNLSLIYVGTFNGREIDKTIQGLSLFSKKYPEINISYDIIGSGDNNELESLKEITNKLNLNDTVTFHGRIANNLLAPYFDKANIGVSYIPITEYYNAQPPTKTFEYVLSGLYTIATATDANKEIISAENGILIKDTPEDFAKALEYIYTHKESFRENKIRESLENYNWQNIVNKYLKPIL